MRARVVISLGIIATLVWSLRAVALPTRSLPLISGGGSDLDNRSRAGFILDVLDAGEFSNRFAVNGIIDRRDIMAMFQVESRFDPNAINLNDGGQGNHAYGIGQMLASTAGDIGITDPNVLFDMETGIRATMTYMVWIFDFLSRSFNRAPTRTEWIGAYNFGVGNAAAGRTNTGYLLLVDAAKVFL